MCYVLGAGEGLSRNNDIYLTMRDGALRMSYGDKVKAFCTITPDPNNRRLIFAYGGEGLHEGDTINPQDHLLVQAARNYLLAPVSGQELQQLIKAPNQ